MFKIIIRSKAMLKCKTCGKKVGFLDNQGNNDNPICFDCANKNMFCEKCNKSISVSDYMSYEGKKICPICFEQISKEERRKTFQNNNDDPIQKYICSTCGTVCNPIKVTKGSIAIEIVLWLFMILPGIIYSLWRLTSRYEGCPKCGAKNIIPIDSPKGKKLLNEYKNG
jgi:hypothetical protein